MSGPGQYPSHQHHVNSHDRIFGVTEASTATSRSNGADEDPGPGAASSATSSRRRRWVRTRTRTQHLSNLSLEDAESCSSLVAGDSALMLPTAKEVPDDSTASPAGRYGYRRPDGNPVTGEGYSSVDSCDLQVAVSRAPAKNK